MQIESGTSLEAALSAFNEDSSSTPHSTSSAITNNDATASKSSDEETPLLGEYQTLDFDNALEFLCFFDPHINKGASNGGMNLHPWQGETLLELSGGKGSSKHPFKYCLCAANGSGKDAFVVAPWALFFICCKVRSLVVITSASGTQLTSQTETYIRSLATNINRLCLEMFGQPILKVNQRHITCLLSGSEIRLFATDEEGKAEGFHPKDFNSEFCIIVNEAKNVAPEIFRALRRCTGYSYWLNVSTPGAPQGDFHQSWEFWPNKRRVTYYDCPHQAPEEFEYDKRTLGEFSPWFRSKWLAEFAFTEGRFVISHDRLMSLRKKAASNQIRWINKNAALRVGIDIALSTAGDESVISIFKGNKQIKQITYRIKDATMLADALEKDLVDNGVPKGSSDIFADDCGVGRAVIDIMWRRGWAIKRVQNNSAARNKKQFRNRGAELWHKFKRLVEEGAVILLDDETLYEQLASRRFKETESGVDKLQLESKSVAIGQGMKSPDRADAAILAWAGEDLSFYLDEAIKEATEIKRVIKTPEQLMAEFEDKLFLDDAHPKQHKRSFGSLNALFGKRKSNKLNRWGL